MTIAAVRGQCLGGGFELVLACDFIIAEEGAAFACPEIKLAVFPPAAAGLVVRTAPPGQLETIVDAWIRDHFRPRSAAALRHGV